MQWDRDKPKTRVREQEEILREYLSHHLYPYSPFYRKRFEGASVSPRNLATFSDLTKVGPTGWNEVVAEPVAFVLRPTERAIIRFGERRLVTAITRAKFRGRVAQLNRDVIDPAYKPIHWHFDGSVPVGYSAEDVDRLAEAGRRVIQVVGLSRDDAIVSLVPPGPNLAYWQLVDGARSAGLSAVHLGPEPAHERIETASPTVLAGLPDALERVLEVARSSQRRFEGLRTVLSVGALLDPDTRARLEGLGRAVGEGDLEVVVAWSPPGVRALWAECRGGSGFHTYPDFEWLETLPDDEVAWTSLAWHGTTFLRLRTGISGRVEDTICKTCGRVGPKLIVTSVPSLRARVPVDDPASAFRATTAPAPAPMLAAEPEAKVHAIDEVESPVSTAALSVLDQHPGVAAWQAEYRRVDGKDELIVFVAPAGVDRLGPLFRELDLTLSATQYVVLRPEQVRVRRDRDGAVLDLRSR